MKRSAVLACLALGLWLGSFRPADAIPLFAHEYGVTCQKCHTVIPHLNEFGLKFMANGERLLGAPPGPAFPISAKVNLVYSSENQGDGTNGQGLPKAIVDEVELFTAGLIGSRANYFVEQYVVDGGQHGLIRDAWINYRADSYSARIPIYVQAGSFTLPLPVDPETFRETAQHYTIYDQTVGNNPFNFFDPKNGAVVSFGDELQGTNVRFFAGPGHDRESGLETVGTDLMGYGQQVVGPFTLSAYRYEGTRPDVGTLLDRFERTGFGFVYEDRRWTSQTVLQTGFDSSYNGVGYASSGGFTQLRYAISPRLFALARYEGTNDPNGFSRDAVALLGYRPTHNARITLEDVIEHNPTTHTFNLQYTVAY